jgi:hypothetical protein
MLIVEALSFRTYVELVEKPDVIGVDGTGIAYTNNRGRREWTDCRLGCLMRSSPTQFELALLTLVVWPLVGAGDQARAGFLLANPFERPPLSTLAAEARADGDGMAKSEVPQESASAQQPRDERAPDVPAPANTLLESYSLWTFGLGQSAGNGTTAAGASGISVSVLPAALNAPVDLLPHPEVCRAYFADLLFRPPPFASRLFRPPRLA